MAWIESHQELGRHPKTRKAARALGVSIPSMVGHLHILWWECLELAEDGDLSRWTSEDIAIAAAWDGDSDAFVDALLNCGYAGGAGFLERNGSCGHPDEGRTGDLVLHDWWEYAGKLVERRRRDRQRKSAERSHDPPQDVPQTSEGQSHDRPEDNDVSSGHPQDAPADASRARTRPDPTRPDRSAAVASEGEREGEKRSDTSRGKPRSDRATRIPDGWTPTAEEQLQAEAQSAGVDLHRELERFRDYWQAQGGQRGRRVDWQATWRNWLRKAIDDKPQRNGRPPPDEPGDDEPGPVPGTKRGVM